MCSVHCMKTAFVRILFLVTLLQFALRTMFAFTENEPMLFVQHWHHKAKLA